MLHSLKRLTSLAASLLLAVSLAGCQGGPDAASTAGGTRTQGGSATVSEAQTTIPVADPTETAGDSQTTKSAATRAPAKDATKRPTRKPATARPATTSTKAAPTTTTTTTSRPTTYDEIYTAHGVAISGMEWGDHRTGTGALANQETYTYFANKGFELFRVAISWERIQPALKGPLSEEFIGHLRDNVKWAKTASPKSKIIIDIHNYAKYDEKAIDSPGGPTTADFADLWVKLSKEFRDEPIIYGYGLMNEPAYVTNEQWFQISQAAVTAVRASGDNKLIVVPGPGWSGAHSWPVNREPWIRDPANNIMYEAHQYFDRGYGGSYKEDTYKQLNEHFGGDIYAHFTHIIQRWADWLNKYKLRGFIGEFAVPYDAHDGPQFNQLLDAMMALFHKNGISTTYWAAGTGWAPTLNAIIQPRNGIDAPQMAVLTKYKSETVKVYR